jgi:hypothetical protein
VEDEKKCFSLLKITNKNIKIRKYTRGLGMRENPQVKEVEAAAERAAAESAAIIERAMGQAEALRRRAEHENASQARAAKPFIKV